MEEKIKTYLETRFLIEFGGDVTRDSDLFKECGVDSSGYLQILKWIKDEFGVVMTDDELFSNVLASLSSMSAFVQGKIGAA